MGTREWYSRSHNVRPPHRVAGVPVQQTGRLPCARVGSHRVSPAALGRRSGRSARASSTEPATADIEVVVDTAKQPAAGEGPRPSRTSTHGRGRTPAVDVQAPRGRHRGGRRRGRADGGAGPRPSSRPRGRGGGRAPARRGQRRPGPEEDVDGTRGRAHRRRRLSRELSSRSTGQRPATPRRPNSHGAAELGAEQTAGGRRRRAGGRADRRRTRGRRPEPRRPNPSPASRQGSRADHHSSKQSLQPQTNTPTHT